MPIQPITPRVTQTKVLPKVNANNLINLQNPINNSANPQTKQMQTQNFGWFPDIFKSTLSKEMDEIKAIKNERGFQRFDKEDRKEIKSYLKNGTLSVEVVKTFAQTNLTIKGMSEVHEFSKKAKNPKQEQQNMLKAVLEFEKPEMKMPQEYKEYRTKLERGKNSTYSLENHDGSHLATYKAGGQKVSEATVTAGPYYPTPSGGSSLSTDDNQNNNDWGTDLRNPMNPLSPFNPINL